MKDRIIVSLNLLIGNEQTWPFLPVFPGRCYIDIFIMDASFRSVHGCLRHRHTLKSHETISLKLNLIYLLLPCNSWELSSLAASGWIGITNRTDKQIVTIPQKNSGSWGQNPVFFSSHVVQGIVTIVQFFSFQCTFLTNTFCKY